MTDDIETLIEWLKIKEAYQHDFDFSKMSLDQLVDDIAHSALLERMLNGEEIYPEPPPLSFGVPWYELLDNGEAEVTHVEPYSSTLMVDGYEWDLVQDFGDGKYKVSHNGSSYIVSVPDKKISKHKKEPVFNTITLTTGAVTTIYSTDSTMYWT